jgi:hypothetical protein
MYTNNSSLNFNRGQILLLNNMMTMYQSNNTVISNLDATNTIGSSLLVTNNRICDTIVELFLGRQPQPQQQQQQQQGRRRHQNHVYYFSDNSNNNNNNNASDTDMLRLFASFLDPIEIHPTPAQIEDATRIVRFGDITNPLNDSCPISLNRFNENDNVSVIRHCNHIFNTTELNSWFLGNCKCPVCRYDIRTTLVTTTDLSNNIVTPPPFRYISRI